MMEITCMEGLLLWQVLAWCPISVPVYHNYMIYLIFMVRTERLELSHLSAPEPKSGASTNFATSA